MEKDKLTISFRFRFFCGELGDNRGGGGVHTGSKASPNEQVHLQAQKPATATNDIYKRLNRKTCLKLLITSGLGNTGHELTPQVLTRSCCSSCCFLTGKPLKKMQPEDFCPGFRSKSPSFLCFIYFFYDSVVFLSFVHGRAESKIKQELH